VRQDALDAAGQRRGALHDLAIAQRPLGSHGGDPVGRLPGLPQEEVVDADRESPGVPLRQRLAYGPARHGAFDDIGDQPLVAGPILARHHHGFADSGQGRQCRFDLLDRLLIQAAGALEAAAGRPGQGLPVHLAVRGEG